MRRAVIDIGTNSVKLLVAEVDGGSVHPLWEESEQTRLGQGFYPAHRLQADAILRTARAVSRLATQAGEWQAALRVIATSAVRDAENRSELLHAVTTASGLEVQVISGEQEADWAFAGVRSDPRLSSHSLLILDVGGGSTEFILGHADGRQEFRASFPLGTVRLFETNRPADPPDPLEWQKIQAFLSEFSATKIEPLLLPGLRAVGRDQILLIGTGGTTSILAAMELRVTAFDRQRLEQTTLTRERVWHFQKLLWSLPLHARRELPGLPPNRADVILFGVAIFAVVMDRFGFNELRVSTRGLRFAAALAAPDG